MSDGSGISCMDVFGQLMSSLAVYFSLCTAGREMESSVDWMGASQGICSACHTHRLLVVDTQHLLPLSMQTEICRLQTSWSTLKKSKKLFWLFCLAKIPFLFLWKWWLAWGLPWASGGLGKLHWNSPQLVVRSSGHCGSGIQLQWLWSIHGTFQVTAFCPVAVLMRKRCLKMLREMSTSHQVPQSQEKLNCWKKENVVRGRNQGQLDGECSRLSYGETLDWSLGIELYLKKKKKNL